MSGVSRRRLLLGMGAVGSVALVGNPFAERPPYTTYTYAQTTGGDLRVAWYETYNGTVQEVQNESTETSATRVLDPETGPAYVADAPGPVVNVGNVLPGDSGSLVVGVLAESLPEGEDGIDVWLRLELTEDAENGVTEPEGREPGEDHAGAAAGELGRTVGARVWQDSGLPGRIGACDGAFGAGDEELASGTLVETTDALAAGVQVASCLPAGANRCVGLEWDLPESVGNAVQTDSVAFDLTVVGQSCGAGNPFTAGTVEP